MQDQSKQTIKKLQKKVKSLEKEISERVRSYLLQSKGKPNSQVTLKSQEVQTDQINCNQESLLLQNSLSYIDQHVSPERSYQKVKANQSLIQSYSGIFTPPKIINFESPKEKQQLSKLLQKLVEQYNSNKKQAIQIQQEIQQPQKAQDMQCFYQKQRKKMRRQIKKLKEGLQFQKLISLHAKQGLLISQEENYRFRLQISGLYKSLQNSRHILVEQPYGCSLQFKLQNQQQNSKSPGINQNKILTKNPSADDFNNSPLVLKIKILQQQNESLIREKTVLKKQLDQVKQLNQNLTNSHSQHLSEQNKSKEIHHFMQKLKDKIYMTSNCIPIPNNNIQYNLFRPENQEQILEVLQRVQQYCKQIEKWQLQRDKQIHNIKNNFISILRTILSKVNSENLAKIKLDLIAIPEMKYYKQLLQQF